MPTADRLRAAGIEAPGPGPWPRLGRRRRRRRRPLHQVDWEMRLLSLRLLFAAAALLLIHVDMLGQGVRAQDALVGGDLCFNASAVYKLQAYNWRDAEAELDAHIRLTVALVNTHDDGMWDDVRLNHSIALTLNNTGCDSLRTAYVHHAQSWDLGDAVGVVGGYCSAASISVATLVASNRFAPPVVSHGSTAPVLQDFPAFMRVLPSDASTAASVAALVEYMSWSSVGVLFVDDTYGHGINTSFHESVAMRGVSIIKSIAVPPSATNSFVDDSLAELRRLGTRVVFMCLHTDAAAHLLTRAVERTLLLGKRPGRSVQWIGCDGWNSDAVMGNNSDIQDAVEGFLGITPAANTSNDLYVDYLDEWKASTDAEYGDQDGNRSTLAAYAPFAVDAVLTFAYALQHIEQHGGDPYDRETMRSTILHNVSFQGISGRIDFDPEPNRFVPRLYSVLNAIDGSWRTVGSYNPDTDTFDFDTDPVFVDGTTTPIDDEKLVFYIAFLYDGSFTGTMTPADSTELVAHAQAVERWFNNKTDGVFDADSPIVMGDAVDDGDNDDDGLSSQGDWGSIADIFEVSIVPFNVSCDAEEVRALLTGANKSFFDSRAVAIVGPQCVESIAAVAEWSNNHSMPVITYEHGSDEVVQESPLVASLGTTNEDMAQSLLAILDHHDFENVVGVFQSDDARSVELKAELNAEARTTTIIAWYSVSSVDDDKDIARVLRNMEENTARSRIVLSVVGDLLTPRVLHIAQHENLLQPVTQPRYVWVGTLSLGNANVLNRFAGNFLRGALAVTPMSAETCVEVLNWQRSREFLVNWEALPELAYPDADGDRRNVTLFAPYVHDALVRVIFAIRSLIDDGTGPTGLNVLFNKIVALSYDTAPTAASCSQLVLNADGERDFSGLSVLNLQPSRTVLHGSGHSHSSPVLAQSGDDSVDDGDDADVNRYHWRTVAVREVSGNYRVVRDSVWPSGTGMVPSDTYRAPGGSSAPKVDVLQLGILIVFCVAFAGITYMLWSQNHHSNNFEEWVTFQEDNGADERVQTTEQHMQQQQGQQLAQSRYKVHPEPEPADVRNSRLEENEKQDPEARPECLRNTLPQEKHPSAGVGSVQSFRHLSSPAAVHAVGVNAEAPTPSPASSSSSSEPRTSTSGQRGSMIHVPRGSAAEHALGLLRRARSSFNMSLHRLHSSLSDADDSTSPTLFDSANLPGEGDGPPTAAEMKTIVSAAVYCLCAHMGAPFEKYRSIGPRTLARFQFYHSSLYQSLLFPTVCLAHLGCIFFEQPTSRVDRHAPDAALNRVLLSVELFCVFIYVVDLYVQNSLFPTATFTQLQARLYMGVVTAVVIDGLMHFIAPDTSNIVRFSRPLRAFIGVLHSRTMEADLSKMATSIVSVLDSISVMVVTLTVIGGYCTVVFGEKEHRGECHIDEANGAIGSSFVSVGQSWISLFNLMSSGSNFPVVTYSAMDCAGDAAYFVFTATLLLMLVLLSVIIAMTYERFMVAREAQVCRLLELEKANLTAAFDLLCVDDESSGTGAAEPPATGAAPAIPSALDAAVTKTESFHATSSAPADAQLLSTQRNGGGGDDSKGSEDSRATARSPDLERATIAAQDTARKLTVDAPGNTSSVAAESPRDTANSIPPQYITHRTFILLFKTMRPHVPPFVFNHFFMLMDDNRSGTIDRNEFLKAYEVLVQDILVVDDETGSSVDSWHRHSGYAHKAFHHRFPHRPHWDRFLLTNVWVALASVLIIAGNMVLLTFYTARNRDSSWATLNSVDNVFMVLSLLEVGFRLWAAGYRRFMARGTLKWDAMLVLAASIGAGVASVITGTSTSNAAVAFRLVRNLRMVTALDELALTLNIQDTFQFRVVLRGLAFTGTTLLRMLALTFAFVYFFAAAGMEVWAFRIAECDASGHCDSLVPGYYDPRTNFNTMFASMRALFGVIGRGTTLDIMEATMHVSGVQAAVFWVVVFAVLIMLLVNVFYAVVIESSTLLRQTSSSRHGDRHHQRKPNHHHDDHHHHHHHRHHHDDDQYGGAYRKKLGHVTILVRPSSLKSRFRTDLELEERRQAAIRAQFVRKGVLRDLQTEIQQRLMTFEAVLADGLQFEKPTNEASGRSWLRSSRRRSAETTPPRRAWAASTTSTTGTAAEGQSPNLASTRAHQQQTER